MCYACDNGEDSAQVAIDPRLVAVARAIDAAAPGIPASDEAWQIFAGKAGGGISWSDHMRMLASYEAAAERATPLTLKRQRAAPSLRCNLVEGAGAGR